MNSIDFYLQKFQLWSRSIPLLLASIWLILWDYDRFRGLIISRSMVYERSDSTSISLASNPFVVPQPTLENNLERTVYITGTLAGFLFFGMLRGLILPSGFDYIVLSICLICLITAFVLGLRYSKPFDLRK